MTTSESIGINQLLHNFAIQSSNSTLLLCDNQLASHITTNFIFNKKTNHVKIDCYFVRNILTHKYFTEL